MNRNFSTDCVDRRGRAEEAKGERFVFAQEAEHLLLGFLREDKALTLRFLRSPSSVDAIRREIAIHTTVGEKTSTSVDLPLSNECKRVLAYAAEEAERL